MKTTNVGVTIALDRVGQALVESSHALTRSEDSGYSMRDRWVLEKQSFNVDTNWDCLERHLGRQRDVLNYKTLRGRCIAEQRLINWSNMSAMIAPRIAPRDRAVVRSTLAD